MKQILFAISIIVAAATPAYGFGMKGHEAICYIAYSTVSQATRQKIDTLIHQDPEFGSLQNPADAFARSCVWADQAETTRVNEHFVKLPRDAKKIRSLKCPDDNKCLFSAITFDIGVLRNPKASQTEKLSALKYLSHWIGDLHQPLNVSFGEHRQGKNIEVKGVEGCENLALVFDICVIELLMDKLEAKNSRELGKGIVENQSKIKRAKYKSEKSIAKWANTVFGNSKFVESLFVEFGTQYCETSVGPEDQKESRCESMYLEIVERTARSPLLPSQLFSAGIGLAELLDKDLVFADN